MTGRPEEGIRIADAALAINPNYAAEYTYRALAETYLGQFEKAKSDVEEAIRLSPRDPRLDQWRERMADAELGLGNFAAAIEEFSKAINGGYKGYYTYLGLATAQSLQGDADEAKKSLAEARRRNPKLTIKWMTDGKTFSGFKPWYDALRKAGVRRHFGLRNWVQ